MPATKSTGASKLPPLKQAPDMNITWVKRSQLNFWTDNPRDNDAAAKELAKIIRVHGLQSPVVVWARNMQVYKGNTTMKALDIINGYPGKDYDVPCLIRHWQTAEEAVAYGIADNRAGENSEWDQDKLVQLLATEKMKPLLTYTGFKEKEIANLAWQPNAGRMSKIEETDEGMAVVVKVLCKPEDAESVRNVLTEWAADSGYENIKVK